MAEYLYPFDKPDSFLRDAELGDMHWRDLKVSELVALGGNRLLVLERGSATTKLYTVLLDPACVVDGAYLDIATRPSLEELSGPKDLANGFRNLRRHRCSRRTTTGTWELI